MGMGVSGERGEVASLGRVLLCRALPALALSLVQPRSSSRVEMVAVRPWFGVELGA